MTREERLEAVLIGIRNGLAEDRMDCFTKTVAVIDAVLEPLPADAKQRPSDREIAALVPTLGGRPSVYYDLVWKLVQEGFVFNHTLAEWSNGEIRGRLCCTPDKAWLRQRDGKGPLFETISQGGVTVTHLAHNQKIEGSTPSPATIEELPDSCLPSDKALAQLGFEKVAPEWPSVKEQQEYWNSLPQYECPDCGTWHPVSPKQDEVNCLCGKLRVSVDADFSDGSWHDRTRLVKA